MHTVYALSDPRTNQIRYIGITSNHPVERLTQHMKRKGGNGPKNSWIDELRKFGEKPCVISLEYTETKQEALACEGFWISMAVRFGWPLTNDAVSIRDDEFIGDDELEEMEDVPAFDGRIYATPKRDLINWYFDNGGESQAGCIRWAASQNIALSKGYVSGVVNGETADPG